MANIIKIKRSSVQDKVPLTTDLALGEIAVNTYDGKMYIKKDDGTASVVEIGADDTLDSLTDVTITSPSNGENLIYSNGYWINHNITVNNMLGLIMTTGQFDGSVIEMLGFFVTFPQLEFKGGGNFTWQSDLNKNLANGGTIIDPDNIGGFDGTPSTLAAFLSAQGTGVGTGCWVRLSEEEALNPNWFGGHNYDSFMATYSAAGLGETIELTEPLLYTTEIEIDKRVNLVCRDGGWFQPNVGLSGYAISTSGLGVNQVQWDIKIFGFADSCVNALYMDGTNLSDITATIQTGCSEYAVVTLGCIIDDFKITCSSNYATPLAGSVMPNNHIRVGRGVSHVSQCHASKYDVRLEGSTGNGIMMTDDGFATSSVHIEGTIEGVDGYGLLIANTAELSIGKLYCEVNTLGQKFTDCETLSMPGGYRTSGLTGSENKFINCQVDITGADGKLEFDADCSGTVNGFRIEAAGDIINNSENVVLNGPVFQVGTAKFDAGGLGSLSQENMFKNPFMDVWSDGPNAAPDGVSGALTTFLQESTIVWPRNPFAVSMYCVSTGVSIYDGVRINMDEPYKTSKRARWVSVTVPIYVPSGQPDLRCFIYDVSQFWLPVTVTEKDAWRLYTFGAYCADGNTVQIQFSPYNAGYVAGNFYIGGCSIVEGKRPLGQLTSSGKREDAISDSITFPPSFVGQRALVAGKWYLASDTALAADWDILN